MNSKNKPEVSIVICQYYVDNTIMLSFLKKLYALKQITINTIVIVQNKDQYEPLRNEKKVYSIRGTNELLDFSAYSEGLDFLRTQGINNGALFFNDTLLTKLPTSYILKKLSEKISYSQQTSDPCVVSFKSPYSFFLQKNPWSDFGDHLCSAVFYANLQATDQLFTAITALLNNHEINKLKYSSLEKIVGKKFFNYLNLVMFTDISGWQPELQNGQIDALRNIKAICFYLEHYFTSLIQKSDGGIIYINDGKDYFIFRLKLFLSLRIWKMKMFWRCKSK